ncbi:hypothetical protein ACFT7S_14435 [Streptomyces sp. NPDC057136]|uniref:hypothetical protein n=1 Tax=Streptomyces sp. NPDC057136 TaxID=3346029 RepID=UPI00363A9469
MDPQQSWSQHKVLAEEFCLHDKRVRLVEEALREAQLYRSRLLAAFAVTVGRDRSAADLLGLPEREVRSARREVGKSNARIVAGDMLDGQTASDENRPAAEWSGDLDAALGTGWSQGVDLHVLAAQIGTDVASVVARLKELSTQGMLRGNGGAASKGRHRKQGERAGSHAAEDAPDQQPQQPAGSQTVNQDIAGNWDAWETQLTHESNNPTVGAVSGVVLEGEVYSPSRYDHY